MGDLDNLKSLQQLFDAERIKKEESQEERERRFIADATAVFLNEGRGPLMEYNPSTLCTYLEQPADVVQKRMGGEWLMMTPESFDLFLYDVCKKLHKSAAFLDWNK